MEDETNSKFKVTENSERWSVGNACFISMLTEGELRVQSHLMFTSCLLGEPSCWLCIRQCIYLSCDNGQLYSPIIVSFFWDNLGQEDSRSLGSGTSKEPMDPWPEWIRRFLAHVYNTFWFNFFGDFVKDTAHFGQCIFMVWTRHPLLKKLWFQEVKVDSPDNWTFRVYSW